jgi:hypothetical protein
MEDLGGDEVAAAALRGDDDGLLGPLGGHGAGRDEGGGLEDGAAPVLRRCWWLPDWGGPPSRRRRGEGDRSEEVGAAGVGSRVEAAARGAGAPCYGYGGVTATRIRARPSDGWRADACLACLLPGILRE